MSNFLRHIPSVHELLESPPLKKLVDSASRNAVVSGVRTFLDKLRDDLQNAAQEIPVPDPRELAERIADWIAREEQPLLRPVINATGILLHTGLGRAPLAEEALESLVSICQGYASVELDLESGQRSQRTDAVSRQLKQLTGAEAALVVNNNAAATLLTLAALAAGQEVVVSRGQLVEIGGSYRLPDVMATSGALLREVGTTNKTHLEDYRQAIGSDTAALMRVHPSNYQIVGFQSQPTLKQLVELGQQRRVLVLDDIGSGALVDLTPYGLSGEPLARASIQTGADLVMFSGDKLLGGPQCGIVVGRQALIERIQRHPLTRAMRVGKLTLAALQSTLTAYQHPDSLDQQVPLLRLLATPLENLRNRAERLAPQLAASAAVARAEPQADHCFLGGGSVPSQEIPTWCVAVTPRGRSVDQFAKALRTGMPSVVGRIKQDALLLDLRTVFARQDQQLLEAVEKLAPPRPATPPPETPQP